MSRNERPQRPGANSSQSSLRRASSYGKPGGQQQAAPPPLPVSSVDYGGWRPPTTPTGLTPTSAGGMPQDRRKSKVEGLLSRKRQSIFAQAYTQQHGNLFPAQQQVPALPSIPQHHLVQNARGPPGSSEPVQFGDPKLGDLDREGLDVDAYLERILAASTQGTSLDTLRRLKQDLQRSLDLNAQQLQENVLSNYANFVTISKELSSLEHEMLELRAVLEQWRSVPESLQLPNNTLDGSSDSSKRNTHRNSIADLAAVRRNQLETLWEAVEGSQKFLPPVAGRHIIAESSAFTEFNAATYKPRTGGGASHLVLLSDAMLVATQRKRQMGSKLRLVADRCFTLSEIIVVDLKDSGQLKHAVKIKRGKETYIFCAERPEDKRNLLGAFKKVAEEMINKKRKQSIWEAETRKDTTSSNRQSMLGFTAPTFNAYAYFGLPGADMSGKDQSWIGDIADELTVHIVSRDFDEAIDLIDKSKAAYPLMQNDTPLLSTFRDKIESRTNALIATLLNGLQSHTIGKTGAIKTAGWLLRLGEADRSRETFLNGRAALVKRRVKQIKFEGNIGVYIGELAMVIFTLIKNTCEWYMAAFKDTKMASGFVRWASQQVELFCEMFRRQVFGAEQDRAVLEDALSLTRTHAMMLRDVGLDFGFMCVYTSSEQNFGAKMLK